MKRLLLNFSYIGTNYKGLQRTIPYQPLVQRAPDLDTIQGILEFGLQKILQVKPQPVNVAISSRTDAGVHALDSTVHVDVEENWFKTVPYSPEKVCQSLNLFLEKNECDIRVKRVVQVPNDFHCRRVFSRVYEFRVAVLNQDPHQIPTNLKLSCATDIRDLNRCTVVVQPFNFPVVRDSCRLFLGKFDFSTFMKTSGEHIPPARRIKTCYRVSVSPEIIPPQDFDELSDSINAKPYDIYTFTIEGSGFLRRQVRRMVGALVGVGRGTIGPKDIVWMLENPSERNWPQSVSALGPSGLFLKQINYPNLEILRGYYS